MTDIPEDPTIVDIIPIGIDNRKVGSYTRYSDDTVIAEIDPDEMKDRIKKVLTRQGFRQDKDNPLKFTYTKVNEGDNNA